jgi:hypothetical protein
MNLEKGTIRVSSKDLCAYSWTGKAWKRVEQEFLELEQAVKLFKAENNFKVLIDTINPEFLKGQLSPQGLPKGARINILPNGKKLDKAFSLFAPHLKVHDQDSHDHWDVLYQNKGGTWSYVYTLEKKQANRDHKYKRVDEFGKSYPLLIKNVEQNLPNRKDSMALPMYTLLKTHMRVGNETYFKAHGHKGLTTLTKDNVHIKDNIVEFDYIGKDGVPIKIAQEFPPEYLQRLKSLLRERKSEEYLFSKKGIPLRENDFKKAFQRYCGKEFYPHIVRSYYATSKVKDFLSRKNKVSKPEIEKLYLSIAHDLGHRKFNPKIKEWQENYTVTINSYIQPQLVEKVQGIVSK